MEALPRSSMKRMAMRIVNNNSSQGNLVQRRQFFAAAYNLAKKVTPKISATEAAALDAGTVGFDRDLFAGSPSLKQLKQKYDLKVRQSVIIILHVEDTGTAGPNPRFPF